MVDFVCETLEDFFGRFVFFLAHVFLLKVAFKRNVQ